MRTSNYRKFKITKNRRNWSEELLLLLFWPGLFFLCFFHVSKVEVMESNHYTKEELKEMVLTGAFSSNSVLAPITCSKIMCRVCHILKDIPSADPVGTRS